MMRLRRRNNRRVFLIAVTVIALGSCLWLVFRPRPSLAPALALAEQRHLDAAEERVRAYLKEYPQSNAGTLLLAQIQLGLAENNAPTGNTPDPESVLKVLANLRLVRPENRKMAASVKLCQGKAEYYLSQFDQAEASWNEALLLEPTIPVAGWSLLDLYYIEGRNEESRHLALTLFEVEPDPHDRVQLLLELVRQDAQPPAPASIVQWFEPRVQQNPGDVHGNIALGLALVRDGKTDRGLRILETTKEHHPELADAWEAWLTGLDDANQVGAEPLSRLVQATERLPSALAVSSRFAKFQARAAQERGETKEAVAAYRRAVSAAPRDQRVEYRFIRALRQIGEVQEAEQHERAYHARLSASQEVRPLYIRANAVKTLGTEPHSDLYQEIADLRERMGLPEEAFAWHRLVLRDDPNNPRSQIALQRLQATERAADARQAPATAPEEVNYKERRGSMQSNNSMSARSDRYNSVRITLRIIARVQTTGGDTWIADVQLDPVLAGDFRSPGVRPQSPGSICLVMAALDGDIFHIAIESNLERGSTPTTSPQNSNHAILEPCALKPFLDSHRHRGQVDCRRLKIACQFWKTGLMSPLCEFAHLRRRRSGIID